MWMTGGRVGSVWGETMVARLDTTYTIYRRQCSAECMNYTLRSRSTSRADGVCVRCIISAAGLPPAINFSRTACTANANGSDGEWVDIWIDALQRALVGPASSGVTSLVLDPPREDVEDGGMMPHTMTGCGPKNGSSWDIWTAACTRDSLEVTS